MHSTLRNTPRCCQDALNEPRFVADEVPGTAREILTLLMALDAVENQPEPVRVIGWL